MKKFLGVCATAAIVLVALCLFGRPSYRHYKEGRALALAQKYLAAGDWGNASLGARQALALNRGNLQACQIMAELAGLARSPHLLDWRRRVVELSPTLENKLALARAGLVVQGPPYPLTTQTLSEVTPSASNSVAFHLLAAELAIKLKQDCEAEGHFQSAAALEPANPLHQVNLAVVRLLSTNREVAAQARALLGRLAGETNIFALRSLIVDNLNHTNLAAAQTLSTRLLAWPGAGLEDKLQHLFILHAAGNSGFAQYLSSLEALTATNPAEMYMVSSWLTRHGVSAEARRWLSGCSEQLQSQMPLPLAMADTLLAAEDWPGLEAFLQGKKWGEFEPLRLAWLSQAAARQNRPSEAAAHWRLAVHQAGNRLGPLLVLLSLAEKWGRNREELLWQLVQSSPRERWAGRELGRLYFEAGNTSGLHRLSACMVAHDGKDFAAQNDLASTSMLLKIDLPAAHQLAEKNYAQHGDDPIIAATYAYSLHLRGRTDEGLAVFGKLQPAALDQPGVLLYQGLLLVSRGKAGEARSKLQAASHGPLLPEERGLLTAALATP